jgi:hypothetical protein
MWREEMKQHDVKKLPLWARDMIERLEADVRYHENQLLGMSSKKETNTYFEVGDPRNHERVYLPDGGNILFLDREGRTIDVRVSRRGGVSVSSLEGIRVYPEASNVVRVEGIGRIEKR